MQLCQNYKNGTILTKQKKFNEREIPDTVQLIITK